MLSKEEENLRVLTETHTKVNSRMQVLTAREFTDGAILSSSTRANLETGSFMGLVCYKTCTACMRESSVKDS